MRQFDKNEKWDKVTMNDILTMMLRESFYRDTLAEAQIYKPSSVRLAWKDESKLITQQHLEALQKQESMRKTDDEIDESNLKLPSFSYLIINMMVFKFQKQTLLLIVYERGYTVLFDFDTGIYCHDFHFEHKIELPDAYEAVNIKKKQVFSEEPVSLSE